jgi:hypothetical protein
MKELYSEIEKQRKKENFEWLNCHYDAYVWFLVQSIVNRKDAVDLQNEFKIPKSLKTIKSISEYLYDAINNTNDVDKIVDYINKKNKLDNLNDIVIQLKETKLFNWGGDFQGSLEKSLIKKYIKNNAPINQSEDIIMQETLNYLYASKYNYLSSKLTENVFFKHPKVIPTVNKIKSVDFFIDKVFWDLKQTILPKGFLDKRDLKELIAEIEKNPYELIKWLYENQGEMRFGSENRIFVVFVDKTSYNESWKLKSDLNLLEDSINSFLDDYKNPIDITFTFKGRDYKTKSNLILISK